MDNELTFHQIVDGISGLITVATADGEVELVNRQVLEYFGKSFYELKGWKTNTDAVHPDDLPRVVAAWERSVDLGQPYEVEHRIRRADGAYRWFQVRGLPVRHPDGRILRWFVLHTDIDERKRAEALLAGEKQVLEMVAVGHSLREVLETLCRFVETAVEDCHCSILLLDPSGTRFVPAAGPTLPAGYEGTVDGAPVDCAAGPCGTAASMKTQVIVSDLASDPRWVGLGWRTLALAHGLRSLCSTPIVSVQGKVLGTFAMYRPEPGRPDAFVQDLVGRFSHVASIAIERTRSEETLKRSEAFLAEAQHLSRTGSFLWRVATDEITWSREMYRLHEFDESEPVTLERAFARVHPEDLAMCMERTARARREPMAVDFGLRLRFPNGSVKHVHTVWHASRDESGNVEYTGAMQDITDRRRAEDALKKLQSDLAHVARVTTLGALTASIAHEVNQPLAGIITNANTCLRMLADDPPNLEGARETERRTIRDGRRASDVITRLRALFARRDIARELVDLNDAIREVIALALSELQSNRVTLRSELADDLPPVTGDRIQLQQVILNLLLNASQAMRDVDDRPRQMVIRTGRDEDGHVRVTVQDAGIGFDAQAAEKLFETFYTTKNGGMGIGLSVSRAIVESHGGRIWATPNRGSGATFSFSLPCGFGSVTRSSSPAAIPALAQTDGERS